MRKYREILGLSSDPFDLSAKTKSFFGGAGRQDLLEDLLRQAHFGAGVTLVSGTLGSGKTVMAKQLLKSFGQEAKAISVHASLFMNQAQFLDALLEQLPIGASSPNPEEILVDLVNYSKQLELRAKTLVLVIDDAHELASEVFELIAQLLELLEPSALHICLLGENHLYGMLENTFSANLLDKVQQFRLPPFSTEDACEYVQHKLVSVGYEGELPVTAGSLGAICNEANGIPGSMTSAIAELLDSELQQGLQAVPVSSALKYSNQYWLAASVLIVLATIVWMTGPDQEPATESVAVNAVQRQQISVPVAPGADAVQARNAAAPERIVDESISVRTSLSPGGEQSAYSENAVATGSRADRAAPDSIAANSDPIPPITSPQKDAGMPEAAQGIAGLQLEVDGYTIQIMGSRSEESVIKFLATLDLPFNSAYFKSSYQEEPWYVAIAGAFDSRQEASAAIADLPGSVRELQPWVRSAADIHSTLRN